MYTTGTFTNSSVITTTASATVTVYAQPSAAPTITQASCTNSNNAINFNITFNPTTTPVPNFTITWPTAGAPNGWVPPSTQTISGAIGPGGYAGTITAANGCTAPLTFTILAQPAPANFTLVPFGPDFFVTCTNPTINITVNKPEYTYTWTNSGASAPITDTEVALTYTSAGGWTIAATNPTSGCVNTHTFSLNVNTVTPVASITPSFQNINCNISSITTVTLTSLNPTVNLEHQILPPPPAFPYIANNQVVIYQPGGPGTYTHILTNSISGCTTMNTFTLLSSQGYPTYSVTSVQNFSLGCSSKSCAVISYTGANTTPIGGAVSYSLLVPGVSATVTQPGPLTGISVYTLCAPGQYTAVTKDNANGCETRQAFSVITKTFSPNLDSVVIPTKILDCNIKQTLMTGYAIPVSNDIQDTANTLAYTWTYPGVPGTFVGPTFTSVVNPTVATTQTVAGTYTLAVRDNNNFCITTTVITINQNLFPPIPKITGTGSITCSTNTLMLSNQSSTGIPPGSPYPRNQNVVGFLWEGPTPQDPLSNSSSYVAHEVGIYTLTAKDLNNGCTSVTTAVIFDNRVSPVVKNDTTIFATLDCGSNTAKLSPVILSNTVGLNYVWTNSISPTPTVSGQNTGTLVTNLAGTYSVTITNTINQCATTTTAMVVNGKLTSEIEAGPSFGYAPLTVTLTNNSSSSLGNSDITAVWNLANGTFSTTNSTTATPITTYSLPGTYIVTAWINKGKCIDSVHTSIRVEVPSSLVVPNVFSPNDDGVNDVFFLKVANLSEMSMTIYDRWGHLVYQLTSNNNVAWDGKNQMGENVSEGTYYYILTAKRKDGQEDINTKGTISLFR
jgi:gliding motility-associated-like protein